MGKTIFCGLQIKLALESHPELCTVPEETRKQKSGLGCDGALTVDDGVYAARIHADRFGQTVLRNSHWLKEFLVEDLAGVYRRQLFSVGRSISSHACPASQLVVIDYLYLIGVSISPHKTDTPLTVDANTVLTPSVT